MKRVVFVAEPKQRIAKNKALKSLMQLEDVLIQIVKELKPEVRRFVNAQKRKDTRTVEQMYIENLRKEKRKKKSCTKKPPNSWR